MAGDPLVPFRLETLVRRCMALAEAVAADGNPPFGAILVADDGTVIVEAANRQVSGRDPTAHAEIELLRSASRLGHPPPWRELLVVSNAEPCSMCASALVKADLGALAYGAPHEPHLDPDLGVAEVFARSRRPPAVVAGVFAAECAAQIAALRAAAPPPD
jgi:tRNA(adenine34) deaminase